MRKILVIEDDPLMRTTIRKCLQQRGNHVLEADNGHSGVALAKAHIPDLIISDVYMEPGDGFDALASMRQEPSTAAIPFIFITHDTNLERMRQGMENGADDYLRKPFTIPSLLAAVEARLEKQEIVKRQAEKKLADLRSSLSLMLPHELNTPIVGILGCGEIISSDAALLKPAELAEMGQSIITSALRLRRVIQNFLLYARIELLNADTSVLSPLMQPEPIQVGSYLTNMATSIAASAERSSDLQIDFPEASVFLATEILQKIFFELLDNAFKFSQPGTPVRAQTVIVPEALTLRVSDKGRGLTSTQISEIGAFVQFDRKIYEQQGSGLGLIISKRLTELVNGTFTIHSEYGVGTTITVKLPLGSPPAASEEAPEVNGTTAA
jgi:signal transduction histidine kinase